VAVAIGVILFSPSLAFGHVPAAAWPFIVASAALEFGYMALLATAYRRAGVTVLAFAAGG